MKIEKAYKKLLIERPFYGVFLLGIGKVVERSIPTACVRRKGICCELVINPDFWDSQNDIQQLNLLQHEIYHLVFQHMFLTKSFSNPELFNIAADCEVNCYLQDIDDNWLTPSMWKLPDKQGTKYYYENIRKQNQNQSLNGLSPIDDHSQWKKDFQDCSEAEKQLVQNQINSQIKATAEQVLKMRGTIPSELTDIVDKLLKPKPRIFDWKSYFRRMLGNIYDINIKKTRRKESLRFPEAAGIKHKKKVSIIVAVDTSGSVNNKELIDFFSEITYIYKAGARITILECDANIAANYEYKGRWTGKVHGRGGTDFQPAIDYYRKHINEYSALVYFTDGECRLPINTPKNVIWVITSGGTQQDYPGKTLYIPKRDNDG